MHPSRYRRPSKNVDCGVEHRDKQRKATRRSVTAAAPCHVVNGRLCTDGLATDPLADGGAGQGNGRREWHPVAQRRQSPTRLRGTGEHPAVSRARTVSQGSRISRRGVAGRVLAVLGRRGEG
jgi:hypothetical protein